MPRLSKNQADARRRLIDVAATGLPLPQLSKRIIRAVEDAVPFDGFRLFGVDPTTHLVNRLLAASDNDRSARLTWLRDVYLRTEPLPYADLPILIRSGPPAVALQEHQQICWGYPHAVISEVSEQDHYRLYHEYASPAGGALLASFATNGKAVAVLQAYRRDAKRPFRAGDVAFVRMVGPVIAQALASSIRRDQVANAPSSEAPDASGIIMFDGENAVIFATPAGEAWSDLLAEIEGTGAGGVATPVWSAVAELRSGRAKAGRIVTSTSVGAVTIEASSGGTDRSVAIVISRDRPPAPPEIPVDWSLTAQEQRIVEQLVLGASNRAIAEALFVSEKTVEWHLWHVFEKLNVSSRGQLLSRYFQDSNLISAFE
jgi:DNA-binding CsgD family transcriptional regulator